MIPWNHDVILVFAARFLTFPALLNMVILPLQNLKVVQ